MPISDLIKKLAEIHTRYGDVGVSVNTHDLGDSLAIIAVAFTPDFNNITLVGR